ncbi:MAG TPA: hypothetical protein VK202_00960 [Bacteroidia bacterium]|nr:hypothetical protein [Bacteroidia bacterium]
MLTIKDPMHIIILDRIVKYFKFDCEDENIPMDALFSPHASEVCELLNSAASEIYSSRYGQEHPNKNWQNIEDTLPTLTHVKKTLRQYKKSGASYNPQYTRESILCLVAPYKIKDETLNQLVKILNSPLS